MQIGTSYIWLFLVAARKAMRVLAGVLADDVALFVLCP